MKRCTNYSWRISDNGGAIFPAAGHSREENRRLFREAPFDFLSHEGVLDPQTFPFPGQPPDPSSSKGCDTGSSDAVHDEDTSMVFITSIRHPIGFLLKHGWINFQLSAMVNVGLLDAQSTKTKRSNNAFTRDDLLQAMHSVMDWFAVVIRLEDYAHTKYLLREQLLWNGACLTQDDHNYTKSHHNLGMRDALGGGASLSAALARQALDMELYFYGQELSRRQMQFLGLEQGPRLFIS